MCEFCEKITTYDVMPRQSDGKLECVDCWVKRENRAERSKKTKRGGKR